MPRCRLIYNIAIRSILYIQQYPNLSILPPSKKIRKKEIMKKPSAVLLTPLHSIPPHLIPPHPIKSCRIIDLTMFDTRKGGARYGPLDAAVGLRGRRPGVVRARPDAREHRREGRAPHASRDELGTHDPAFAGRGAQLDEGLGVR